LLVIGSRVGESKKRRRSYVEKTGKVKTAKKADSRRTANEERPSLPERRIVKSMRVIGPTNRFSGKNGKTKIGGAKNRGSGPEGG